MMPSTDPSNILEAFLLENGAPYHIANTVAILEYILTLYFKPSLKSYPYISVIGDIS